MAYHQVSSSSLQPSRPAPQAPQRRNDPIPLYSTSNASASSGYNNSFYSSSPSQSSYTNMSYSGIGGTPNRGSDDTMNSQIIRNGTVSMKEDGFGNWLWQRKWLVLKEQTLSVHRSEVRQPFPQLCVPFLPAFAFLSTVHHRPPRPKTPFGYAISPTSSGQISNLTVCSLRPRTSGISSPSRMTKNSMAGKTMCTLGAH